jgi:hypothetical protein
VAIPEGHNVLDRITMLGHRRTATGHRRRRAVLPCGGHLIGNGGNAFNGEGRNGGAAGLIGNGGDAALWGTGGHGGMLIGNGGNAGPGGPPGNSTAPEAPAGPAASAGWAVFSGKRDPTNYPCA